MKKLKANALSRIQLKKVLGEVTGSENFSTNCSTTCPGSDTGVSITSCNGSCTCDDGVGCSCVGETAVLTKSC